ncbi:MAG: hypothetical protein UT90_C0004G0033 [Parcubacteria group bacterium GW2011_GWA1_40_21]|nr:MAG: hypothetical protein UT80_C0021G0006 [Parcubacteria group bacterium GW2011_GWC1_40_13]KKR53848.1 MAG: hypothetical protein UT90_C0004G0033 [Parcubacteria group bacterium GW2011_GWA1_40_21]
MPFSGDKIDGLSLQLIVGIENFVRGFCLEKKISQSEIPEIFNPNALNRLARNLGLRVKVEELTEEPISAPKETPLEIIDRIVTEVANNEAANSSPSGIESALRGHPMVIL